MPHFTKSIRWRFAVWFTILLTCVLSGFGITAYQLHQANQYYQLDEELSDRVTALSAGLRSSSSYGKRDGRYWRGERDERRERGESWRSERDASRERSEKDAGSRNYSGWGGWRDYRSGGREIQLPAKVLNLFDTNAHAGFYFTLWLRDDGVTVTNRSANTPAGISQPMRLSNAVGTFQRTRDTFREAYYYTERGDCVLAGRSIATDLKATRHFAGWLVAGGIAVLALGISGVWLLAGRALKPVEEISAAAARISAGNLAERINVAEADDELGQLAGTLNATFARLEAAFARKKQFTADASHELRTPIAVLISEAQTTLAHERTAEEYRAAVGACLDTAQQMRRLTESLLQLARVDAGREKVQHQPFDLAETARACVELIRPLADKRGIQILCDLAPARVSGDVDRFSQVIANLLTNAIQYNKSQGEIRIRTRVENGTITLTVADTGQGIAPADQPHIFERFYRADKARSRTEGCSDLGLAICKAIVEAAGGHIEASSQPGVGSTFTVRLPSEHLQ